MAARRGLRSGLLNLARGASPWDALSNFGTIHFEGAFFNEELVAAGDTNKFIATGEDGRPKTGLAISVSSVAVDPNSMSPGSGADYGVSPA
jgi:hypothetical protein